MAATVTSLFDNKTLSRLERLRIRPRVRKTNRSRGEHLHGKGGTSTEFTDYRDYVAGDDVRFVDWNIFSRLNRPYLKLYKHEEEMHVVVIIDASSSMQFDGKFERAKQLGAAFALMGLMNLERVSIYGCNYTVNEPVQLPPCSGRVSMRRMFQFVEALKGGGDAPIETAVDDVLGRHRGRGVVFVLSDFLTLGDLGRPMNRLFSAGLEISAIQILGPSEINPEITGDLRFVDCETGLTLDVTSAGDLLGLYQDHRLALEAELAQMCQQRNGRFLSLSSQDPLEWVLFDVLRRKGWVR